MAEQRSTLIIEISSEQALRNARALDRELQSIERTGNHATTSMNSMSVACRQLAGYMMGVVTVGGAIAKMDDWTNLNNRLRLVTDTQKELTIAMKDTFDIAQRSGAAWGGTATIYQKIQYNSEKLGLSQIQVAKVTESISKSISNSGSSAQAASAALYQLGQSFDKSSLNGDEFVSMSENAGYLMDVFAKGLGVTRAELKEMSSDGKLTTDKMIEAIQKMSGSIEDDFGKTNFTIGQSFTQVSNAVTKFVGESGQATGAATAISGSLSALAENLNAVTNIAMIGGAYWIGTYIPALYTSTIAGYGKIKQLVEQTAIQYAAVQAEKIAAIQELAGAEAKLVNLQATRAQLVEELRLELARKKKQISDQGAINSELRMGLLRQQQAAINVQLTATENALATARTRSAAAATATLGVSSRILGVMTGPIGIGISIATVAAGYLLMRDSTAEANKKLEEQTEIASRTKQELLALQGVQKNGAKAELQEAFKGQNKELKDLNYLFNAHTIELQNAYRGNLQITEISNKVREGTMSQADAIKALNKLDFINPKQLKQLQDDNKLYEEKREIVTKVQEALKLFGINVELAGNKASNASSGVAAIGKEAVVTSEKVKGLDADIQKFISNSLNNIASNEERLRLYAQGYTKESADMVLKYREAMGLIGTDQQLPLGTIALMGKELLVQTQLKEIEDKRTKAEKDRTKEAEKKYKYTQAEAKLLSKAYGDVSKSGLGAYAESKGIPANVIAGLYMQESKAGTDLTSHTGAKGNWQTTAGYREQNNISMADNNDFLKVGKIVVDNIAKVFADTGNLRQAILSHNAGETGASNFMKDGRVKGSDVRNKEVAGYLPSIDKWASWASGGKGELLGKSDSGKDYQEFLDAEIKRQKEIQQLRAQFDTEAIQRSKERDEQINQATLLGQMDLIPKIRERYNKQELLASYQLEMELNGYKWGEDQKIEYRRDIAKLELEISGQYGKAETELRKNGIDALAQYEIDEYRKTQQLKIAEYQLAFSQPLTDLQAEVWDMQAKANMGGGYGAWALQNQYGKDLGSFGAEYDKNVDNINEDKTITDDATRKQLLLDAEESFRLSKLALNEKYTLLEQDLAHAQYESQMSQYSQMISIASDTWGRMTSVIKDAQGENSAAYKAMFFVQQTMAAAQAIIYANVASAAALAPPPIGLGPVAGMPLSGMIKGSGYANAALIMAQGLAGMAHNGIDNIPKEGTWLLDGGERVLNPQQNKDLTNYLSKSKPQGANIVINNNGSSKVVATQDSDGKTYITIDELPGLIAGQLRNPNSQISKSVQQNTTATRRR